MPDKNKQQTDTTKTNPPVEDQGTLDVANSVETAESSAAPEPIIPEEIKNPSNIDTPKDQPEPLPNTQTVASETDQPIADPDGIIAKIIEKIADSHNILIALSSDPSVDEISSAIGLSLFLDKLGKRATAIYSGVTPNALEFLKPEETFETTADTLQDFVIAINKEKADHLRYKLDGDYVRIYITPYKTKVSKDDLEFSYGDFNVDLVLALDVANGIDLDQALREHGRIMHDATVIDITTGNPGKLGEIEWSDKTSSSISEMLSKLIYSMDAKEKLGRDEATAFLTGIVAATNRFSEANTSAETMRIASKLMESGADQQLISKNISTELESELYGTMSNLIEQKTIDPTALDVEHEDKTAEEPTTNAADISEKTPAEPSTEEKTEENQEASTDESSLDVEHTKAEENIAPENEAPATDEQEKPEAENPDLLNDLKAAEDSLANAGAETTPETPAEPLQIKNDETTTTEVENEKIKANQEKIISPSPEFDVEHPGETKYGKMLEDAIAEPEPTSSAPAPAPAPAPASAPAPAPATNPAASVAPTITTEPDISTLPDINYAADGDMILPPPPTPPIDFDANSLPTPPNVPIPDGAMPTDLPPDFDPSSFKIPGM